MGQFQIIVTQVTDCQHCTVARSVPFPFRPGDTSHCGLHSCAYILRLLFFLSPTLTLSLDRTVKEPTNNFHRGVCQQQGDPWRSGSLLPMACRGSRDIADKNPISCQGCTSQTCFSLSLRTAGFAHSPGIQHQLYAPKCQTLWHVSALKQSFCTDGVSDTLGARFP